jgi:hypothetical protein
MVKLIEGIRKHFKAANTHINSINNSKLLTGIVMLLLNVGSKYIEMGFSKTQEEALRNGLGREILIFAIIFMGTRDIIISILMTAAFIILSDYLLNENSKLCVMPNRLKNISYAIDKNKDNIISEKEEKAALDILRKVQLQKEKHNQGKFMNYLDANK